MLHSPFAVAVSVSPQLSSHDKKQLMLQMKEQQLHPAIICASQLEWQQDVAMSEASTTGQSIEFGRQPGRHQVCAALKQLGCR